MAKTKFFRVAVAGATVDGRTISAEMIQQMADTYNPATYTANINCEHLRGYSPEGPFNNWGSVVALKAEKVEVQLAGKTEQRLALFAQFEVTDAAMEFNKAGQKLFSSVEIQPEFAGTSKAYLVGLAFTDSPASIATELLKFSRDDKRNGNFIAMDEIELAFEDAPAASDVVSGAFAAAKSFFESFGKKPEPVVVTPPAAVEPAAPDAFAQQLATQFAAQFETLGTAMQKSFSALETRIAAVADENKKLAASIEGTPSRTYSQRPPATGGGGERVLAEC